MIRYLVEAQSRSNLGALIQLLATASQKLPVSVSAVDVPPGDSLEIYDTAADLRAVNPEIGRVYLTRGALTSTDAGGGPWVALSGPPGTYVDNTGTVLRPTAVPDGSVGFERLWVGSEYRAIWFGRSDSGAQAALNAAAGASVLFEGSWTITTPKTVGANTTIVCEGTFVAGFNGVLFPSLPSGVKFVDARFAGQGATYPASGFASFAPGTNEQALLGSTSLLDSGGYQLDWLDTTAGSQFYAEDLTIARRNGALFSARIQDAVQLAAYPRTFAHVQTNNTNFLELGGCNNLEILSGYIGGLLFSANSRGVQIGKARVVNGTTIRGGNHTFDCLFGQNAVSGDAVVLEAGASGINLSGAAYNGTYPVRDLSGQGGLNQWVCLPVTAGMLVTQAGGGFALGNGECIVTFARKGATVSLSVRFRVGSTTVFGAGALRFNLTGFNCFNGIAFQPVSGLVPGIGPNPVVDAQFGSGQIVVPGNAITILPRVVSTFSYITCFYEGGGVQEVTGALPFALAANDEVRFTIDYYL